MIRLAIAALLIYAIWRLWKRAGNRGRQTTARKNLSAGEMVPCDRCGTFVLGNEAIKSAGKIYCSEGCHRGN